MRRRWSVGAVVAIAVAIAAAAASGSFPIQDVRAAAPVRVTLALQSDAVTLRVASDAFVVTLEF